MDWQFSPSGFEGLGVQPIRFQGAESSSHQVSRGWELRQSYDFDISLSASVIFTY